MPPDDPLGRHGPSLENFLRKRPVVPEHKKQPCPYGKFPKHLFKALSESFLSVQVKLIISFDSTLSLIKEKSAHMDTSASTIIQNVSTSPSGQWLMNSGPLPDCLR